MSRSLEEIYQDVANLINESLDEQWKRAWVVAQVESDNAELDFQYQTSADAPALSFADKIEDKAGMVYFAFDELRTLMASSGQQPWKSATFTLESDGTFKIDYAYD